MTLLLITAGPALTAPMPYWQELISLSLITAPPSNAMNVSIRGMNPLLNPLMVLLVMTYSPPDHTSIALEPLEPENTPPVTVDCPLNRLLVIRTLLSTSP